MLRVHLRPYIQHQSDQGKPTKPDRQNQSHEGQTNQVTCFLEQSDQTPYQIVQSKQLVCQIFEPKYTFLAKPKNYGAGPNCPNFP
jgi:hypothetical protein